MRERMARLRAALEVRPVDESPPTEATTGGETYRG
jgi:hypothetical protein